MDTSSCQQRLLQAKPVNLGCLAATCAIRLNLLEEAVELLDLGRSVIWQQASSLRSDLDTLKQNGPELAIEVERVGRQEISPPPPLPLENSISLIVIAGERTSRMNVVTL
jgi:hypothetical protein